MPAEYIISDSLRTTRVHALAAALAWTVLVFAAGAWTVHVEEEGQESVIHKVASSVFNKDVSFRYWVTEHGGVYVPPTKATPPNPYLKVPHRDVVTQSGQKLTLMNPAYALRKIMAEYEKSYGIKGHITSLKLLNPNNAPDAWETATLKSFESGKEEASQYVESEGKMYYRYMQRLVIKPKCLKCHSEQGYKVGQVRGGISLTLPVDKFLGSPHKHLGGLFEGRHGHASTIIVLCGAGWIVGIIGIGLFYRNSVGKNLQQQKTAEQVMRLARVIDESAEGVMIWGNDGLVSYVNPVFCQRNAAKREDLVGNPSEFISLGTISNTPVFADWLQQQDDGSWSGKRNGIRPDGLPYSEEVTVSAIRDQDGGEGGSGYVAVCRDVTREIELEKRLFHTQKMEAIGTLAGGIAHDFNNLLQVMTSYAGLLQRQVSHDPKTRDYLTRMETAQERASRLVKQILAFSRQSSGTREIVYLQTIVSEVTTMLRETLPSTIDLKIDVEKHTPPVYAEPGQIHQLIMNLCTNAFQALPEQTGVIELTLEQVDAPDETGSTLLVGDLLPTQVYMRITVVDNGEGMEESTVRRVFEPFFTTKEVGQGTGMGLAIIHGIVQNLDGAIAVTSSRGEGTSFRIYLPTIGTEEQEKLQSQQQGAAPQVSVSKRIMLIDDEDLVLLSTKIGLESMGCKVTGFSKAKEALAEFESNADGYDLVITDLTMPEMTGIELAEAIHAHNPQVAIVLSTGFQEELESHKQSKGNFADVIKKPYRLEALAAMINSLG